MSNEKFLSASLVFLMDSVTPFLFNVDKKGINIMHRFLKYDESIVKEAPFSLYTDIPLKQNECVFVVDYDKKNLVSNKGFHKLTGYHEGEITFDLLSKISHPDDQELIRCIIDTAVKYSQAHPEDILNNTLFISFRLKKKNGSYIKILGKYTILNIDDDGRIMNSLVKFTDISSIDKTNDVSWDFSAKNLNRTLFKQQVCDFDN